MVAEYDIAISFAGEDRAHAEALADFLTNEFKFHVFYDDYEQAKLWGSFLPEKLLSIYRDKARACVVLISEHYKLKRWTTHEWRAAQERALNEPNSDYILPVRLDDTVLDGLFTSLGFIDARKHSMRSVARMIFEKIGDVLTQSGLVRLADQQYREGLIDEALETASFAPDQSDVGLLRVKGNAYGKKAMYVEAIECFEKIVNSMPRDFTAHFHLGIYNFRLGRYEESVRHYEIADALSPNHPTIQTDLPFARKGLRRPRLWYRWRLMRMVRRINPT